MKLVVVIPCWNKVDVTQRCVQSMLRGAGEQKLHFVFVDNGSTDGTGGYLATVPDATVIRHDTNLGVTRAWNAGLKAALDLEADIVVLSNNDLVMGQAWADVLVAAFRKSHREYFLPNGAYLSPDHLWDESAARLGSGIRTPGRGGWCLAFPWNAIEHFLPIPDGMTLWYGDDYIHEMLADAGWDCMVLDAWAAHHYGSASFKDYPDRQAVLDADRAAWNDICRQRLWRETSEEDMRTIANMAVNHRRASSAGALSSMENVGGEFGIYYDFLYELVLRRRPRPRVVVELGTYNGVSACVMAEAGALHGSLSRPMTEVVTVDIRLTGDARDRCAKWSNITAIQRDSRTLLSSIPAKEEWIDILFIDSDHTYEQAKAEFDLYYGKVKGGGIVLFDDIRLSPEMERFWSEIPDPKGEDARLHHTGFGWHIKPKRMQ